MIIKNIRCGYDGGGVACGPLPGTCFVEVTALEEDGSSVFVLDSVFDCFEKVSVCSMSVFDIAMNMMADDSDFESEFAKIEAVSSEEYEINDFEEIDDDFDGDEENEEDEEEENLEDEDGEEDGEEDGYGEDDDGDWNAAAEYDDSRYCSLIKFTRFIMDSYLHINESTEEGKKTLSNLVEKYKDIDLNETDF